MKVSGMQVSPAEIENALLAHPGELINDVAVAGVQLPPSSRGRKERLSERVPRAWVVLTAKGQRLGAEKVAKELNSWVKQTLSKYKQLRGGIGVVPKVRSSAHDCIDPLMLLVLDTKNRHRKDTSQTADRPIFERSSSGCEY